MDLQKTCLAAVLLHDNERKRGFARAWYAKNRLRVAVETRARYHSDPVFRERMLRNNRAYNRRSDPLKRRVRDAAHRVRNLDKIRAYYRAAFKKRYTTDAVFNLVFKLRRRIHQSLRRGYVGIAKADKTINLLGCSYAELRLHIENKFTAGMTWDGVFNGKIHLDHIRPLDSFDMRDPRQQAIAFHWTNLQPLWRRDNIRKGTKLMRQSEFSLA